MADLNALIAQGAQFRVPPPQTSQRQLHLLDILQALVDMKGGCQRSGTKRANLVVIKTINPKLYEGLNHHLQRRLLVDKENNQCQRTPRYLITI